MENFLNKQPVRDALGVGDIDFVSCSSAVYDAMVTDWMRNLEVGIPTLLEDGIKLLVYAGEYDLICNWLVCQWIMRWMKGTTGALKFILGLMLMRTPSICIMPTIQSNHNSNLN
ncbi:Carboxypeptidase [Forsythia ovata]|uniref:Carboxypeptidase n=1 Tax=Forsythia ovata TaxID=205694 RepID=A0ABD1WMK5_9LAMI